jgi:hypothetical protein
VVQFFESSGISTLEALFKQTAPSSESLAAVASLAIRALEKATEIHSRTAAIFRIQGNFLVSLIESDLIGHQRLGLRLIDQYISVLDLFGHDKNASGQTILDDNVLPSVVTLHEETKVAGIEKAAAGAVKKICAFLSIDEKKMVLQLHRLDSHICIGGLSVSPTAFFVKLRTLIIASVDLEKVQWQLHQVDLTDTSLGMDRSVGCSTN